MPELGTGNPVIMMTVQRCTIINLPTLFEIRMVGLQMFICSNFELYNKTTEWTPISLWKRLVIAVTTFSMARRRRSPELRWRRDISACQVQIMPHIVITYHLCASNILSFLHACYVIEVCII
jgi:hypothetical protein